MDASAALQSFNVENNIKTLSAEDSDKLYKYDQQEQTQILNERPWTKDPHYFKHVKISAVALIKMVTHARSGGAIEVMGLMQGKIQGDTMIVMDAFALPVEGTETRVNAHQEAYEYMVQFQETIKKTHRPENAIGWYHSHPGYGCWLSGIDVTTQMTNQQYQEPFLAVVIDPNRTISAGKVEIGAFRTYPKDYTPPDAPESEYQSIPLSKIEDFGVHAKRYYQLDVSIFKSNLDTKIIELLWNKYWVETLGGSLLSANYEYTTNAILDLAEKLDRAETPISQARYSFSTYGDKDKEKKKEDNPLTKAERDSKKVAMETSNGLVSQILKNYVFNSTA
ncbi:COP9 signalosome complex subunit 5B [Paraphysoderma sedebokerense]|nr:COP9 signalosome complex subunit 5B [Paraphysoderma sedebokerense]